MLKRRPRRPKKCTGRLCGGKDVERNDGMKRYLGVSALLFCLLFLLPLAMAAPRVLAQRQTEPPEEDEPFVFPEGVYDAAILTTSDLSYGRSVKTCARLSLIREEGMQIPILIVLPHPSARDRARLLDAGADYVLAEPFVSDELAAVLRALARRSPAIKSEILTAGDLTFDRGRCTVKSRSGEIRLSGKETLLIDIFLSNPGQVVSRETIQARVWGSDSQSTYNSIEVYLTLLRRKLRSIGSEAQICAERGLGYYLAE